MRSHHYEDDFGRRSERPEDRRDGARAVRERRRGAVRSRGPRGRMARGDVRTAILLLLADEPMHGYQLMQAIADRSGGRWTPSPGAIYPALGQLEDEGLVTVTAKSGRKVAALTETGYGQVQAGRDTWPDPFAGFGDNRPGRDLQKLLMQLHGATRQLGRSGSDQQIDAAAKILTETRRSLYLLLAEGPDGTQD